jgi:hypothetical protein
MPQGWQDFEGRCQFCHSWHEFDERMITAMNIVIALLVIAFTAALLWKLVKDIAADGRGHRPPPRSHLSDLEVGGPRWWIDVSPRVQPRT